MRCRNQANTPHIMLGRGAVTRPDLVNQIKAMDKGDRAENMAWQALLKLQIAFLQGDAKSENMLVGRYKQWLGMLTQGYEEANELWQNAKKIKNLDEMLKLLAKYL
jgi:tRNA-dihydrouridine synthase C